MRHLTEIALTEVGGFQVGHAEDSEAMTGCTAILFDDCSPAGVDVRGGGPASRETPLLNPLADAKGCTRSCFPAAPPSGWTPGAV